MNNLLLTRVPPHSIDIEEAVLSALFITNKGFERIDGLLPEDFYKGAHKKIFSAMLSLKKRKESVDLMTVAEELDDKEELESIGGAAYLASISDAAPVAVNVGQYAKRVMDLAKAREMIQVAAGIMENGFTVSDIESYISDSQANILGIQTSTSKDKFFTMAELMADGVDRIEKAQTADLEISLNLGLPKLNNFMQVWGSKLILLAGRPGMGKTSLAWSMAIHLGYQGKKSGVLSIEMDKEQYADKAISGESGVNSMGFYIKDFLGNQSVNKINDAARNLSVLPILIDDSECGIEDVKRKCRKFKKAKCEIIFIDQLSQVSYERGLNPYVGISKNCNAIKQLTKELRIPIVLLCQLSRKVEDRAGDNRPIISDLAETGKLEQDADMILFLFREGHYKKDPIKIDFVDPSVTEIELAKNRQGEKGVEKQVVFIKKSGMFQMSI